MEMYYKYRIGERKDCEQLAKMIQVASGGVVEYLFRDLVSGMSPVQVLAENLGDDNYPYTYRSAIIACEEDEVVGMALSFPSSYHTITDQMREFFPAERLAHLSHYYSSSVKDSWFIDVLCVLESHRRHGIGRKLISLTTEVAIEKGFNTMSLVVFADNELALPVYQHAGFTAVQYIEIPNNEFINHSDGCLLMKCDLTRNT